MKLLVTLVLALILVSIPQIDGQSQESPWLIMVYMDGDRPIPDTCYYSLEDPAIMDINEMERGISDGLTVVVQIDRGLCDPSNEGWDTTRRYLITSDRTEETGDYKKIDSRLIEDIGEANMGDPETLIDFATWASSSFPAERRALILWDHGSGWIDTYPQGNYEETPTKSVCADNGDELTLKELGYAMERISAQYPIDLLGFDACLMQMIEVAYELKDYAPVIVGSEEIEPATGWSYDIILQEARYAYAPEDLARIMVESYVGTSTSTLSAIRTYELPYVVESLNTLCSKIMSENMDVSLNSTYRFNHLDENGERDYADLYSFGEAMQAIEIMEAVERCVIAENHGPRANAHGISIWMPAAESNYLYGYRTLKFSYDSLWDEFIAYYLSK